MTNKDLDPKTLSSIHECMSATGLEDFANASWRGFVSYATNKSNPWGKKRGDGPYIEYDPRQMDMENITVYETCNFASNVAYYRAAVSLCDSRDDFFAGNDVMTALIQAHAALASGSSLFHASGSIDNIGMALDNLPIALLAVTAHQASVSSLNSSTLTYLTLPTNRTAIQITQEFVDILTLEDVQAWNARLNEQVVPYIGDYKLAFAAIISTVLNLIVPAEIVDPMIKLLSQALLDPSQQSFIETDYNPLFQEKIKDIHLSWTEKMTLALKGGGTLLKLAYAFLWQEEVIPWSGLTNAEINKLGGDAIPVVNMIANAMNGFPHPDKDVQAAYGVYPGDTTCRISLSPHSKWHEQAGNGLLDLMFLTDDVNRLLTSKLHDIDPGPSMFTGSSTKWLSWWANHWWGDR